ncbi:N-acyl amino acid synthase FeeM domain-containing protein [Neptunomonas japonica]|uniref:N-acyl amino acid synthase FeeM domain-containing protein n=1 Tax=Neptunomonas japonica TaxID=417574 RepID=UPI0012EC511D|nr:hypothetical protein [Neptunomonas japonica]
MQAFELVWQRYTKVGLHPLDSIGKRVTKYHLLPKTKVFIASSFELCDKNGKPEYKDKVIGTLTVVHDSSFGLPAEELCKKDIVELRRNGEEVAEITSFVCNQDGQDKRVFLKLFRLAYEYCSKSNVSGVIASLTQRHIGFYRRFLGFQALGQLSGYKFGNGAVVQAHFAHLKNGRDLLERRTAALFEEDEWRDFWGNEAEEMLTESLKIKPLESVQLRSIITSCSSLQSQIDAQTASALNIEYSKYGVELGLVPMS